MSRVEEAMRRSGTPASDSGLPEESNDEVFVSPWSFTTDQQLAQTTRPFLLETGTNALRQLIGRVTAPALQELEALRVAVDLRCEAVTTALAQPNGIDPAWLREVVDQLALAAGEEADAAARAAEKQVDSIRTDAATQREADRLAREALTAALEEARAQVDEARAEVQRARAETSRVADEAQVRLEALRAELATQKAMDAATGVMVTGALEQARARVDSARTQARAKIDAAQAAHAEALALAYSERDRARAEIQTAVAAARSKTIEAPAQVDVGEEGPDASAELRQRSDDAQRYAHLLVSEIKRYHDADMLAEPERNLHGRLKADIERYRRMNAGRIAAEVRATANFLGRGDPELLPGGQQ